MDNDRKEQETRDRNVTEKSIHRGERGELDTNEEIDDDAMIDEATRSQIGAGE